jgi:hypothetical protein
MCGFALVAFILLVLIVSVFLPSEKRQCYWTTSSVHYCWRQDAILSLVIFRLTPNPRHSLVAVSYNARFAK